MVSGRVVALLLGAIGLAAFSSPVTAQAGAEMPKAQALTKPWEPNANLAAIIAGGNLQVLLLDAAKDQRGVHVETLMTMVGALAGFSAQHAIWETVVKTGKLPEHGGRNVNAGAFAVVGTKTGETYYFGDLLNAYLIPQSQPLGPSQHTLWGFLAAGVKECGGQPLGRDQVLEIFRNAAATVGDDARFGVPRLPEGHRPRVSPREALTALWPAAVKVLSREYGPAGKAERVSPGHWPTVVAMTAQKLIVRSKGALDPTLSMRIVLEAAVPMSKVDPKTVPRG